MFSFATLWRTLFRRRQVEQELSDELLAYADLLTEEKMGRGMESGAARRSALL